MSFPMFNIHWCLILAQLSSGCMYCILRSAELAHCAVYNLQACLSTTRQNTGPCKIGMLLPRRRTQKLHHLALNGVVNSSVGIPSCLIPSKEIKRARLRRHPFTKATPKGGSICPSYCVGDWLRLVQCQQHDLWTSELDVIIQLYLQTPRLSREGPSESSSTKGGNAS